MVDFLTHARFLCNGEELPRQDHVALFIDNAQQYLVALRGVALQAHYGLIDQVESLLIDGVADNLIPLLFLAGILVHHGTVCMQLIAT